MQADLFYQSQTDGAIPLFLISKAQWLHGELELSNSERNQLSGQHFTGQSCELCLIYHETGLLNKVFLGMGDASDAKVIAFAALSLPAGSYQVSRDLSSFAEINWALAQYCFSKYKKLEKPVRRLVVQKEKITGMMAEIEAVFLIRDLINTPPNDMGPQQLAEAALTIANQYNAEFTEWVGEELLKANFPAIHAVGRASKSPPRLVQFTWGEKQHPRLTLIGKGVCFDSGGLDIKPASGMRLMKKDMGGAAHALGLAQWVMARGLPVRLQVLIPAVENSIGSDSFRPGDVLTMRNGLTVEIDNTDAEGRLVLADALSKACEEKPELIINFATLTGAARVAVGTEIAAMFTPDDQLAASLFAIAEQINDPVWRLPLFAPYESMLESTIADMVNSSPSPYAGATTAALFLKRFISSAVSWVHFDVMAWNLTSKPGKPEGGEAMAFRALAKYLAEQYGSK